MNIRMKTRNKKTDLPNRITACLLVIFLLVSVFVPVVSAIEPETIYIGSAKELLQLAKSCSLDEWSREKRIVITKDIDLSDMYFPGIPSFGGMFDGQGHTISGFSLTEALSPAGV